MPQRRHTCSNTQFNIANAHGSQDLCGEDSSMCAQQIGHLHNCMSHLACAQDMPALVATCKVLSRPDEAHLLPSSAPSMMTWPPLRPLCW